MTPSNPCGTGTSPKWRPADGARDIGSALEAHYRFVTWLIRTLEGFPRSQKFLLSDRIQSTVLFDAHIGRRLAW